MKHLLIIGAGGFGREIFDMAPLCQGYGKQWELKGFLDDTQDPLGGFEGYAPVVGKITGYAPLQDDVFICAIGSVPGKRKCVESILARGGQFINLIHKTATLGRNVQLGYGCIIQMEARISSNVTIGDFTTIQDQCMIGHDVSIAPWCHLHPRVFMGGFSKLQEEAHIGYGAFVHPKMAIGARATVAAGAYVFRHVKPGTTVIGNPATTLH